MASQTPEEPQDKLKRLLVFDLCEFVRDVCSSVVRVYIAYTLMTRFHVGAELAFATALMLGGTRAISSSTNWLERSRARLRTSLQGSDADRAPLLVLFLKDSQ